MGQKINPTGFRMGITLPFISRWNAPKSEFPALIVQDVKIRDLLSTKYDFAGVAQVDIERSGDQVTVIISTARPGLLIGRKGKKLDEIKAELDKLIGVKDGKPIVKVNINEIGRPELDARIVAQSVKEQMQKRMPFRRVCKKTIAATMAAGAKGIKIRLAGRLSGAEMARTELQGDGQVPLTTISADISYCSSIAKTTYGVVGVKIWIYRGEFGAEQDGS